MIELMRFNPNEVVKRDLLKLADYLASLPPGYGKFHMDAYAAISVCGSSEQTELDPEYLYTVDQSEYAFPDSQEFDVNKFQGCNSFACAIGHTKLIGLEGIDVGTVCWRAIRRYLSDNKIQADLWMFDNLWSRVDNTPVGATARIYFALNHGVPIELDIMADPEDYEELARRTNYMDIYLGNESPVKSNWIIV